MTAILDWILGLPEGLVWLALTVAAGIEYVFPPFPGDAVVLAGSVLAGHRGLDFIPIFAAVTLGSLLGAWIDFEVGRWLAQPRNTRIHRWFAKPKIATAIGHITRGFAKHGDFYLVINRFLPGIRALFFVAAGMAGYGRSRTLVIAVSAATLWNGLILIVGAVVGANLEALLQFAKRYGQCAWLFFALGLMFLFLRHQWRKKRKPEEKVG